MDRSKNCQKKRGGRVMLFQKLYIIESQNLVKNGGGCTLYVCFTPYRIDDM